MTLYYESAGLPDIISSGNIDNDQSLEKSPENIIKPLVNSKSCLWDNQIRLFNTQCQQILKVLNVTEKQNFNQTLQDDNTVVW